MQELIKKYEVMGFSLSILLHTVLIGFLCLSFSSYTVTQKRDKNSVEVHIIERIVSPESSEEKVQHKTEKKLQNQNQEEHAMLMPLDVMPERITAQDFMQETKLPIEKIDFELIKKHLLEQIIFPKLAKENRWQGKVQLALTINSKGNLIGVSISKSSNQKILDDAVLMAGLKLKNIVLPKPAKTSTLLFDVEFT